MFINSRSEATKLLIILSSGYSSDTVDWQAQALKESGVQVFSFAFGSDKNIVNLIAMATGGQNSLIHVSDFEDSESYALDIRIRVCSGE